MNWKWKEKTFPASVGPVSKFSTFWNIHNDGSLRSPDGITPGGREYVLASPAPREEVRPLLDQLFKTFDDTGARIILSNRTSTHVHINISDLKINQIVSFMVLWNVFEEALVNWCGEERVGNLFCLRTKDCSRD